jgi:hypothetical protein
MIVSATNLPSTIAIPRIKSLVHLLASWHRTPAARIRRASTRPVSSASHDAYLSRGVCNARIYRCPLQV